MGIYCVVEVEVKFMTLTPQGYKPRLIEKRLDTLLRAFGCVEITGAKWCGKTWTALSRSKSVTRLDRKEEREPAQLDPLLALMGETPHLVDEWQEVPEVWDAARRFVDDTGNNRGLLLLTGSTQVSKQDCENIRHSGTGRIAHITMRPMSLYELGISSGEISLHALLNKENITAVRKETSLFEISRWCCRGGWPSNLNLDDDIAFETAQQYIQSVLNVNILEEGKSTELALALMRALALNASQSVTYKTLLADMSYGEFSETASVNTLVSYLDLFQQLNLIENLYGWEPAMRSKARVRVKPKRYFVDPSLAAALLYATPQRLLKDVQTLGLLFENLVLRDLNVYLSTYSGIGNTLHYYRDDKGLEVDAIIEYQGGWAGIEIKLSDTKVEDGVKNLLALKKKMTENQAAQNPEPLFLAVIVGKGSLAYQRPDGIFVIPIATLGA